MMPANLVYNSKKESNEELLNTFYAVIKLLQHLLKNMCKKLSFKFYCVLSYFFSVYFFVKIKVLTV